MSDIIGSLSAYDENIQKENEKIEQSETAKALTKKDPQHVKRGRMTKYIFSSICSDIYLSVDIIGF